VLGYWFFACFVGVVFMKKTKLVGSICFNLSKDQDTEEALAYIEDHYKDLIQHYGFEKKSITQINYENIRTVFVQYVAFPFLTKEEVAFFSNQYNQLEDLSFSLGV